MSEIVGPYPPIRIMITLDERTGAVTCQASKPLPVFTMVATLSQLITQFVTEAAKAAGQPKETPSEMPSGNNNAT